MTDDAEPPRRLAARLAELLSEMAAVWAPAALHRPAPDEAPAAGREPGVNPTDKT